MHKVNVKRLNAIQAAPLGIKVVKRGEIPPDPSDLPVADMPEYFREVKPPEEHQTIEDRLVALCDALGGAHRYREPLESGQVKLTVKLADGTVLGGVGDTTTLAFNQLLDKAKRFEAAGLKEG